LDIFEIKIEFRPYFGIRLRKFRVFRCGTRIRRIRNNESVTKPG
jgi:hypothetical protein